MLKLRQLVLSLTAICAVAVVGPKPGLSFHPNSPEVQRLVEKGIRFIEQSAAKKQDDMYNKLGGTCVAALAILKHTGNQEHPLVVAAVEKCRRYRPVQRARLEDNYSVGLGVIFLCELDPVLYRPEIEKLLGDLMYRQIPGGAWTYEADPDGDTSQTQYAALAMWIAFRSGIPIPRDAAERCCNWLIRTQAPNGGFTYKSKDPGNFTRIEQDPSRMTPTMGAAGVGSLYICSEILGFLSPADEIIAGLPPAIKEVRAASRNSERSENIDGSLLKKAIADGNRWLASNTPAFVSQQSYYYMYSMERYQAFRELAENRFEKEPTWYNNSVRELMKLQSPEGSWSGSENGAIVDTSFAVLFLLRSARNIIAKILEKGLLIGGRHLPKDLTNINLTRSGKVVSNELTGKVDDILKLLEDPNSPQGDFIADVPEEIKIESDPAKRSNQMSRLKRLAMSGSFQARLTAVKSLGKIRELDNVPVLIFALSDPDPRIIHEARASLRLISRKFSDFGPTKDEPSEVEKRDAQRKWGEWYKSIRPDGELIE